MAKFDKVRTMYLRSNVSNPFRSFDPDHFVQKHPHTCIVIQVNTSTGSIHYALARRESPGRLTWLKKRIQKIKEVGGLVPVEFYQQLNAYRKNFTKKRARIIATRRLDQVPRTIPNVDCSNLTAHKISRLVMENIADNDLLSIFEAELNDSDDPMDLLNTLQKTGGGLASVLQSDPEYVRESAKEWLEKNVPQHETLPSIKVAQSAAQSVAQSVG